MQPFERPCLRHLPTARPSRFARWLPALVLGLLAAPGARAQSGPGDLLVAPTRIVLEGRQRTAEVTLVNRASGSATYRISFVHLRMTEEGGTREIAATDALPGELFADDLIRFSPRQVTLEPGVAQTVRMQLRKPADLAPGEYRSHLLFRAIPASEPLAAETPGTEPSKEMSIKLTPIYGVSIPVIVRHGETSATVKLDGLELVPASGPDDTPGLRLRMSRTGNQSVHGNFTVTFLPASGKPLVVGLANGVAVYTPNPTRLVVVPLRLPAGAELKNGLLRVALTKPDKATEVLAEADLRVP